MRAAVLYGPGDLRVEHVPDPEPGADEVLVRIEAASTCGTDRKMLERGHPTLPPYPCRFGHEMAGVVVAAAGDGGPQAQGGGEAEGAARLVAPPAAGPAPGTRVAINNSRPCGRCTPCLHERPAVCRSPHFLFGGFAELIAVPVGQLVALPAGVDATAAAMAEPLSCALHAVGRAELRPGESCAVAGGGPMGLMMAALALRAGAEVVVCDPNPERLEVANRLGAGTLEGRADRLEAGAFDAVVEAVGRPEAWRQAIAAAAPAGRVVFAGGCSPGSEVPVPTATLHYDEVDLRGAFHHSAAEYREAVTLLAGGAFDWRALTGPEVGLEGLADALRADGPVRPLKLVVRPGS